MLNFVKRTLRTSLDALGFELRRKKQFEQADDPYHALPLLLDSKEVTTIIDAGASIGDISQKLAKLFPLATVHAVEPYPPFHESLESIASKNKHIQPAKLALSDQNGSKFLQINKSEGTNSLLKSNEDGKKIYGDLLSTTGEIKVKSQTLDDFIHEHAIEQVDLLKIDLQGSELPALIGASKALSEGRIKCILCEIMFHPSYESQSSAAAILHDLTEKHNYHLFNLYQPHYHHGYLLQTDALLFHSSIHSVAMEKAHLAFYPHSAISAKVSNQVNPN
ncbi:MAG: FkbM family methyltransferase [Verrucomicrobia bacterium]|nr:FkbM family methyltransferase [Verrucomicrobiota bacterium]MDA1047353.1 FkbM family methyltransferase [Verrucomicrobiota bacterium]